MALLDFLTNPQSDQYKAISNLANLDTKRRDEEFMGKIFAANPDFAQKLYGAKNQQEQLANQQSLADLEKQKADLEMKKQSALASLFTGNQPQAVNPQADASLPWSGQSALATMPTQQDENLIMLTKMAQIDPKYAPALIEYKMKQQEAMQPDWQVKEVNGQLVRYDARNPEAGALPMTGGGAPLPDIKGESELRKEFDNLNKDYRIVETAYNKIKTVEKDPSAAGDLSLIFSYMKLLDPSSTVREGEFATAQNAAGVPTQVQNLWNRAKTGERLSPEQRADFLNQANNLYQSQAQQYTSGVEKYRGLASEYGFNPDRIVKPITNKTDNALEKQKAELRAKIAALKGKK